MPRCDAGGQRREPPRQLLVEIGAPPTTFSDRLYFPNATAGFTNEPGCVESYAAVAKVRAFENGDLVDTIELRLAALEFGGHWRCPHSISA